MFICYKGIREWGKAVDSFQPPHLANDLQSFITYAPAKQGGKVRSHRHCANMSVPETELKNWEAGGSKNYDSLCRVSCREVIMSSQNILGQPLYQNADWMS